MDSTSRAAVPPPSAGRSGAPRPPAIAPAVPLLRPWGAGAAGPLAPPKAYMVPAVPVPRGIPGL